jgi:hypothetical protein
MCPPEEGKHHERLNQTIDGHHIDCHIQSFTSASAGLRATIAARMALPGMEEFGC